MLVGYMDDIPFITSGFLVRTFDEWNKGSEARWEKHDLMGRKPVLEFIGPDVEEISFKMLLRQDLGVDPRTEIRRLEVMRDEGAVFPLVLGNHTVGDHFWVLTSLSAQVTYWNKYGNPLSAEVSVTLREYAEEEAVL